MFFDSHSCKPALRRMGTFSTKMNLTLSGHKGREATYVENCQLYSTISVIRQMKDECTCRLQAKAMAFTLSIEPTVSLM